MQFSCNYLNYFILIITIVNKNPMIFIAIAIIIINAIIQKIKIKIF